jgi:hypothetical protein
MTILDEQYTNFVRMNQYPADPFVLFFRVNQGTSPRH